MKEKEPKRRKGTRRVKIVLCPVIRKIEGGKDEGMKKLNGDEE